MFFRSSSPRFLSQDSERSISERMIDSTFSLSDTIVGTTSRVLYHSANFRTSSPMMASAFSASWRRLRTFSSTTPCRSSMLKR